MVLIFFCTFYHRCHFPPLFYVQWESCLHDIMSPFFPGSAENASNATFLGRFSHDYIYILVTTFVLFQVISSLFLLLHGFLLFQEYFLKLNFPRLPFSWAFPAHDGQQQVKGLNLVSFDSHWKKKIDWGIGPKLPCS